MERELLKEIKKNRHILGILKDSTFTKTKLEIIMKGKHARIRQQFMWQGNRRDEPTVV